MPSREAPSGKAAKDDQTQAASSIVEVSAIYWDRKWHTEDDGSYSSPGHHTPATQMRPPAAKSPNFMLKNAILGSLSDK